MGTIEEGRKVRHRKSEAELTEKAVLSGVGKERQEAQWQGNLKSLSHGMRKGVESW